jgi:hypothetical protein
LMYFVVAETSRRSTSVRCHTRSAPLQLSQVWHGGGGATFGWKKVWIQIHLHSLVCWKRQLSR